MKKTRSNKKALNILIKTAEQLNEFLLMKYYTATPREIELLTIKMERQFQRVREQITTQAI